MKSLLSIRASQIKRTLAKFGITIEEFCSLVSVNPKTLRAWEIGETTFLSSRVRQSISTGQRERSLAALKERFGNSLKSSVFKKKAKPTKSDESLVFVIRADNFSEKFIQYLEGESVSFDFFHIVHSLKGHHDFFKADQAEEFLSIYPSDAYYHPLRSYEGIVPLSALFLEAIYQYGQEARDYLVKKGVLFKPEEGFPIEFRSLFYETKEISEVITEMEKEGFYPSGIPSRKGQEIELEVSERMAKGIVVLKNLDFSKMFSHKISAGERRYFIKRHSLNNDVEQGWLYRVTRSNSENIIPLLRKILFQTDEYFRSVISRYSEADLYDRDNTHPYFCFFFNLLSSRIVHPERKDDFSYTHKSDLCPICSNDSQQILTGQCLFEIKFKDLEHFKERKTKKYPEIIKEIIRVHPYASFRVKTHKEDLMVSLLTDYIHQRGEGGFGSDSEREKEEASL